jgi:hypothetical protein
MANAIDLLLAAGIFIFGKRYIDSGALDGVLSGLGGGLGGGGSKGGGGDASPAADDSGGGGDTSSPDSAGDSGGTGGSDSGGGGCDCSCMPMDTQKGKFKIETAAGVDCYNHVYPSSMAECETALKGVCAKRGGGGGSSTPSGDTSAAAPADASSTDKTSSTKKKTTTKKKKKKSGYAWYDSYAGYVYMPEQIDPGLKNILTTYQNQANQRIKDSAYTWSVSNSV